MKNNLINNYLQEISIKDKTFIIRLLELEEMELMFPLINILNEKMTYELFSERLKLIIDTNNYQCVGIFDDLKNLVACAGLWQLAKFYIGKHLEVDNVAVLSAYQNYGLGTQLMNWVENYAKEQNCVAVELNAYIGNEKAHKFYFNRNYKIMGFHFRKEAPNPKGE